MLQVKKTIRKFFSSRIRLFVLATIFLPMVLTFVFFLWITPEGLPLFGDPTSYFRKTHGRIIDERTQVTGHRYDGYIDESVHLTSSNGLQVRFNIRRPAHERPCPAVMLLVGYRTGRNATSLIDYQDNVIFVALDYPFEGDTGIKGLKSVLLLPKIRKALFDTIPATMLVNDYLQTQAYIQKDRIELIGVSLGAPLACVAGAMDHRFSRVWVIEGGGKIFEMFFHLLKKSVPNKALRYPAALLTTLIVSPLVPEKWVGRISPRNVIMVNASLDETIPRICMEALFSSAREPKELIWVETDHVNPRRPENILPLIQLVQTRINP